MDQLILGIALGFGAGIAPGPLLGLIVASTLRRGWKAGLRLALVPLISDAPLIAVCLSVLASLPSRAVAVFAEAGGVLLLAIGWQTVRDARTADLEPAGPRGHRTLLLRGILVNYLNPHPWLFWIGVGGPLLISAWRSSPPRAAIFVIAFYTLIVGTKVGVAAAIAITRGRLSLHWYRRVLAGSGVVLGCAGVALAADFWHRAFT